MKKLQGLLAITLISVLLTGCGAPKPPLPFGHRIAINAEQTTISPETNGTQELFESHQQKQ